MSAPKLEWLQEFSFTPLETRSCVYKDSVLKEEKLIFSTFSKETSIFIHIYLTLILAIHIYLQWGIIMIIYWNYK
jgi:hypothetical protein